MFGGSSHRMEDLIFQLRFSSKQLERMAKRAEKDMNGQKAKVKRALQQGNVEGAKIYAENAIRKKNESLNYLRFAGKVDAVQARVQSAAAMQQVTRNMGSVVKSLEAALNSMDLQKVQGVMDKFERQFENLDVHTSVLEGSMGQATTLSAPEDQIAALMRQVAEENGLDVAAQLPAVDQTVGQQTREHDDQLTKRLAALRE